MSIRGLYSDEANDEAERIMNQKSSALNISGSNSKVVAKEVFNSFYEMTKDKPDKATVKHVTASDSQDYLNMSYENITRGFLADIFADVVDSSSQNVAGKHRSKYNSWDAIDVPADNLYPGQPAVTTTIGRYFTNKFVLQGSGIIQHTGFINSEINKKGLGNLDSTVGTLYLEDKIDRKQFDNYTDRRDTLGYWMNGMLAHTISEKMVKPLPQVEKKKAELLKKYEKELASGDIDVMTKVSDELVEYAKEILKDDPGMDLYSSGDLDFNNNYKNNSIVKGAVLNKLTDEYDFIGTSFMDGIEIKDLPAHANSIVASQYPASIETGDSGYMGKKLVALMQLMQVDEPGSDCHTKKLIPMTVTNTNKNDLLYRYIDNGSGQLVMLDSGNINQYLGKTVKMRSPMTCLNKKICSKCAGKLFEMMDIQNAGLFSTAISHASLNAALKQKHMSNVELAVLDPDAIIEDL